MIEKRKGDRSVDIKGEQLGGGRHAQRREIINSQNVLYLYYRRWLLLRTFLPHTQTNGLHTLILFLDIYIYIIFLIFLRCSLPFFISHLKTLHLFHVINFILNILLERRPQVLLLGDESFAFAWSSRTVELSFSFLLYCKIYVIASLNFFFCFLLAQHECRLMLIHRSVLKLSILPTYKILIEWGPWKRQECTCITFSFFSSCFGE